MSGRLIAAWAVRSLSFHRTRTLLTVLAVGLATALVANTLSFQAGYERSLRRDIDAMGYQVLVTGKGCPHEAATLILRGGSIPMYIQEHVYAFIASDPAVKDSTRFLMQSVPAPDGEALQLVVGVDEDFARLKPEVGLQRGGWFTSMGADEAVLGFNVAEYRRLEIGDRVDVQGRSVVVRGVLDRLGTQDDGTIFLPLGTAQALFEKRDRLTGVGLRLHDMAAAPALIDRLYELPSVQVIRMSQVQSTILRILDGIRSLLLAFGALCLLVALMGVFNVALMSVHERSGEMGVLRALGCSGGLLFRLVWSETLVLSAMGALVGALLALGLRGGVEQMIRSTQTFVPSGPVVAITPGVLLTSAALVIGLSLLAGVYPAWRSAATPPLRSMRGAV